MLSVTPTPVELIDDDTATKYYNDLDTLEGAERETRADALRLWAEQKKSDQKREQFDTLNKIYSDFDGYVNDAGLQDFDEDSRYRTANRQFIASQFDQTPEEQKDIYSSFRDKWTESVVGKKGMSEKETFDLIKQGIDARNEVSEAANQIPGDIALSLFDSIGGNDPVDVPKLIETWKTKNADSIKKLPPGWEAPLLESAQAFHTETEGMLRDYAEPLKKVYDHLAAVTGRDTERAGETNPKNQEEMDSMVDTLASMPKPVRERAYASVVLGAQKAGQDPKKFMEQWGESWSRTLNMVRTGALTAQEMAAESDLRMLEDKQIPPDYYISKSTGEKIPLANRAFYDEADLRKVTPEEIAAEADQARQKVKRFEVVRELQSVADNQFDPIEKINKGGFLGFMEAMAYGSPQGLAYTATALVPVVGPYIAGAAMFSDEYNQLRQQGMSVDQAVQIGSVSAAVQAGLERTGAKAIFGKLPAFEKLMRKIGNPARVGKAGSAGVRFLAAATGEQLVEGAQDLTTPLVQDVSEALGADVPDVKWQPILEKWGGSRLDVLAASLPTILLGTGVSTFADNKRFAQFEERQDRYRMVGMDDATIKKIEDGKDLAEVQQNFQSEFGKLTPENVKAGIAYMEGKIASAKDQQEDPNTHTLTRETLADGSKKFVIRDPKGDIRYTTSDEQTAQIALSELLRTQITGTTRGIFESISFFNQMNEAAGRGEDVQKFLLSNAPRNLLTDYEANPTEQNLNNLFETVRAFGQDISEPAELANFPVLASNQGVLAEGIFKSVIQIHEGATGDKVVRDVAQDNLKRAIAEGRIKMEWVRENLNQIIPQIDSERITGYRLRTETDTDVIESFSDVALAYMVGDVREEQIPEGFRGFLRRMAIIVKDIYRRAYNLKRLVAEGKVDANFETLLADSVGLNQQARVDTARERVSNEVLTDTNYSIGKTSYPMEDKGKWYSNEDFAQRGGRISTMSPDEFLSQVRPLEVDEASRDNIDDLKNMMQSGRKLDPLAIYADGKEDGRHRATAAKELGMDTIPVLDFRANKPEPKGNDFSIGSRASAVSTDTPAIRASNATITGPANYSIGAFHGTPHKVDKFSTEKIGTGEGAQAYGWGLYFAENKGVAEGYQRSTSQPEVTIGKRRFKRDSNGIFRDEAGKTSGSLPKHLEAAMYGVAGSKPLQPATVLAEEAESFLQTRIGYSQNVITKAKQAIEQGEIKLEDRGNLYTVELDVEPEDLLDWDKPFSEQSPKVQAALAEMNPDYRQDSDEYDANERGQMIYARIPRGVSGNAKVASDKLLSAGIPGIRYLDGGSRSDGEGTYNYVVFDENLIKITEENGNRIPASQALAAPSTGATNYSIGKKQDADYLAAVERGDMETAQKMVDEAAKTAGYIGSDHRMQHSAPDRESTALASVKTSGLLPNDYWEKPQFYQSMPEEWESFSEVRDALNRSEKYTSEGKDGAKLAKITVYRSVPKSVKEESIRNGDWVTPSKEYAAMEGRSIPEGYKIISQKVSLKNLWWDGNSIAELGFDDGKDYAYKNTKNNRKLIDPVTYDENGNVIPLSQRFNQRSADINYSIGMDLRGVQLGADLAQVWNKFPKSEVSLPDLPENATPDELRKLAEQALQNQPDRVTSAFEKEVVLHDVKNIKGKAEHFVSGQYRERRPEPNRVRTLHMLAHTIRNAMAYGSAGKNRFAYIYRYNDGTVHVVIVQNAAGKQAIQRQFTITQFDHDTSKQISGIRILRKKESGPQPTATPQPSPSLAIGASEESATHTQINQSPKDVNKNYSIASQSEIDRVNRALGGINRGPDERLKVYQRAKQKFSKLMAWNSDELAAMADTGADDSQIRRTQILQGLGELDGIMSVLPPEVRGRVGGYTKLAGIAPHDVFKDGVKVSEVSGMNGAIISAWMREGQNIGQAGKQVSLPPGYTATENLSTKRADKAIADFFRDRIKKIDAELEKVLVREYTEAITKVVKQSRPKAGDNGVRKSTLGAETQKFADMVQRATLLDDEATPKRMAEIEAALANPDATAEDISALSEEWSILNTFGDLDNRSSETLAQGLDWLKGQLQMGREAWRIKEQARIDEQRARAAATIEWLGKGTAKKRFADKGLMQRIAEVGNNYLLDHASFEQFVTAMLPPEIAANFSERLRKADMAAQSSEIRDGKGILDAVREGAKAANMSAGDAMLWLKGDQKNAVAYLEGRKVKDERIAIELAQKIVTGEADRSKLTDADIETLRNELAALPADTQKEYVTIKRVIFRGEDVKLDMSRAKAIQLLLSWSQPDVQIKMRKEGWTDESATDLKALVNDPVSRSVVSYLQSLYGKGAGIVNPVYSRMFGMTMPQVKNYAPTRFLNAKDSKDIGLDGSPTATGTTPSFAKSRVTHSAKIAPEDALTVAQGHIAQQAHWVHFAELAREFRALLSSPDVRESLKQAHGDAVLKSAELWADQLEQRGGNKARESAWLNNVIGTAISGKAVASLGFNLKTLAMQLENTIRFGLSLDMKQIASALSQPGNIIEDIQTVWESDAIQNRLQGGATAEARFLFSRYAGKPNFAAKIAEASMTPINWLDSAGTSISSAIVYRANLNDALDAGMPENLAKQAALNAASEAIYRFAQPVSFGQKSIIENNGNVFAKTFFLFMSDPRLKTAILADAARGLATGRGNASEHIRRIVAVELMALVSHVISSAFKDTFSDDDDEEIWGIGGFAKAMLLAPFQGFFFAGSVAEVALSKLTGQGYFTSSQNPLLNTAESAIRAGSNLDDAFNFSEPDAMLKEWNNIFRSMALSPSMAVFAVLLNMVKPVVGLYQNATSEE